MKSIRLAPVRHEPPDCLDFDDEDEVRRYEVAMRVHRAHAEGYFVTPLEGRVDGAYQVVGGTGASGDAWIVDVVDASGTHDTCTCHDFLGNQLGTCKHLEAVRRAIARVPDLRRAFSRLGSTPRTATLTVTGIGGPRLAEVGPWKARLRARLGMVRNAGRDEVTLRDAAPLLPGLRDAVRVGSAFRPSKRSRSRSRPSSARPRLRRPDRALPGATASSFCSARTSRPRRPWYRRMQDAWLRHVAGQRTCQAQGDSCAAARVHQFWVGGGSAGRWFVGGGGPFRALSSLHGRRRSPLAATCVARGDRRGVPRI